MLRCIVGDNFFTAPSFTNFWNAWHGLYVFYVLYLKWYESGLKGKGLEFTDLAKLIGTWKSNGRGLDILDADSSALKTFDRVLGVSRVFDIKWRHHREQLLSLWLHPLLVFFFLEPPFIYPFLLDCLNRIVSRRIYSSYHFQPLPLSLLLKYEYCSGWPIKVSPMLNQILEMLVYMTFNKSGLSYFSSSLHWYITTNYTSHLLFSSLLIQPNRNSS